MIPADYSIDMNADITKELSKVYGSETSNTIKNIKEPSVVRIDDNTMAYMINPNNIEIYRKKLEYKYTIKRTSRGYESSEVEIHIDYGNKNMIHTIIYVDYNNLIKMIKCEGNTFYDGSKKQIEKLSIRPIHRSDDKFTVSKLGCEYVILLTKDEVKNLYQSIIDVLDK